MRRAFTLIELLVIIGIMGAMVSVCVVSVRSGQDAARVKGAARDLFATVRLARTKALVTGQRVIVEFTDKAGEDDSEASVNVVSAKIMNATLSKEAIQPYYVEEYADLVAATATPEGESSGGKDGQSVEEILFEPVDATILRGVRLKVDKDDDTSSELTEVQKKSGISVFSNVDALYGLYRDSKSSSSNGTASASSPASSTSDSTSSAVVDESHGTVATVWETNGMAEPHTVHIYANGQKPESGLCFRVDKFGGMKILSGDGREDE